MNNEILGKLIDFCNRNSETKEGFVKLLQVNKRIIEDISFRKSTIDKQIEKKEEEIEGLKRVIEKIQKDCSHVVTTTYSDMYEKEIKCDICGRWL